MITIWLTLFRRFKWPVGTLDQHHRQGVGLLRSHQWVDSVRFRQKTRWKWVMTVMRFFRTGNGWYWNILEYTLSTLSTLFFSLSWHMDTVYRLLRCRGNVMLALINDVTRVEAWEHGNTCVEGPMARFYVRCQDREEAVGLYYAANNLMSLTFLSCIQLHCLKNNTPSWQLKKGTLLDMSQTTKVRTWWLDTWISLIQLMFS